MNRVSAAVGFAAHIWLGLAPDVLASSQVVAAATPAPGTEAVVTTRASGTFDVDLKSLPTSDSAEDTPLGRMSIDKTFHGDLEAVSTGEMLSAMTGVKGSAGYVAIERVRGTLHGRTGTFVLQHSGTMTRGAPHLTVTVVPDSGTGELAGLAGSMRIIIEDGQHRYELDYTLAPAP
jgi:hypothetical protein